MGVCVQVLPQAVMIKSTVCPDVEQDPYCSVLYCTVSWMPMVESKESGNYRIIARHLQRLEETDRQGAL